MQRTQKEPGQALLGPRERLRLQPSPGARPPGSLGLVDGPLELLLQLPHAAHGRVVARRRLLVHQLAPRLGLLRLHDLRPQQRGRGQRGHTQNGPLLQDHVLYLFKKDEESGINIYMLLYVKDINHKDLCIANGTLPNIL